MTDLIEQLENYRHHFDRGIDHDGSIAGSPDHSVEFEPDEGDLIMVDIQTHQADTDEPVERTQRTWLPYTILAAAAVIVVVVAVVLSDGTEESTEVDVVDGPADVDAPAPTDPITPQPGDEVPSPDVPGDPLAFTESDAVEIVDAYYQAVGLGDAEAIAAAFSPEASLNVDGWVRAQVWAAAIGTMLSSPMGCDASDGEPGSFVVQCMGTTSDYLHEVAGAPTTPFNFWYTVTSQGIERVEGRSFQEPPTATAFDDWMMRSHPGDRAAVAGLLALQSIEEVDASAELYKNYADLWAEYLIEEGCTHAEIGC